MISMMDIFNANTPEKVLYLMDLMKFKNAEWDDIFDIHFKEVKRKYRYLDIESQLKMTDENVIQTLKYMEEKLGIVLGKRGYLVNKDLDV